MLSGVGPRQHLSSLGIPVIADLAGVGQNFQDHMFLSFDFRVRNASDITISGGRSQSLNVQNLYNFLTNASGPLTGDLILTPTYVPTGINGDQNWPDGVFYLLIVGLRKLFNVRIFILYKKIIINF